MENPNSTLLINNFCEMTSCTKSEALIILEKHNFDLDSAVSTFLKTTTTDHHPTTNIADVDHATDDSISINIGPREDSGENRSDVLKLSADQLKEFKNLEDRLQTLKGAQREVFGGVESGSTALASLMLVPCALATSIAKMMYEHLGTKWLYALLIAILVFYLNIIGRASMMRFNRLYYNSLGLERSIEFARLNMEDFLYKVRSNIQENGVAISMKHVRSLSHETSSPKSQLDVHFILNISTVVAAIASVVALTIVTLSD
ncbi:hypothetical protein LIER_35713 [Lithospermum erythrorhizon]|uniref:Uncharacterized protein n=1 Tax=Lithospermum erythrorhizon TaxID=34254 RepID=A0AAV3NWQ3_LITER